jgi:hypothetical protein
MPNAWFRMYSEIRSDPKVRTMPESHQLRLIWLFTLRCDGPTENLSRGELMYGLACDETLLETLRVAFLEKGFIEDDWSVSNWNKRQYVSDSSTERVRKFRKERTKKRHETLRNGKGVTDQNRTEQIQNREKPSRAVRASGDAKHSSDPRHIACKAEIFLYYRAKNETDPEWNGREGKALGMLLGANPKLTAEGMRRLLDHRARSEVNHAERPGMWIENLGSFRSGPLDRFGKPEGMNGARNGHHPAKTDGTLNAAKELLAELRGGGPDLPGDGEAGECIEGNAQIIRRGTARL